MMSFAKVALISGREFLCRVRRKSFALATLFVPVMTAVAFYMPAAFAGIVLDGAGEGEVAMLSTLATGMVFLVFIMMFGGMVMSSVCEEKTGRIMDVLLTSAKSSEIVLGKITGTGFAALLQLLLWVIVSMLISLVCGISSNSGILAYPILASLFASPAILLVNLIFFVLGYVLYASMFAVVGISVKQEGDAQPFQAVVNLPLLIAYVATVYGINAPDSDFFFWCGIIPFTSPVTMPARMMAGASLSEVLTSLTLLLVTALAMLNLAAGTYRRGSLLKVVPVLLLMVSCSGGYSWRSSDMDSSFRPGECGTAPVVERCLEGYRANMNTDRVIGKSRNGMNMGKPESQMSDWAADMLLGSSERIFGRKADVSLLNMGGIRQHMPSGEVKVSDIKTIFPFDDKVVYVTMKGSSLRNLLQDALDNGSSLAIGGMRVEAEKGKIISVVVGGRQLEDIAEYGMISVDFLLDGGDRIALNDVALQVIVSESGMAQTIVTEVENQMVAEGSIDKKCDGRFLLR